MSITLKSRYGANRTFTVLDENTIRLTIEDSHFVRGSCHPDTGRLDMIDPDGGPMLMVGCNLSEYDTRLPDVEITSFDIVASGDTTAIYDIGVI